MIGTAGPQIASELEAVNTQVGIYENLIGSTGGSSTTINYRELEFNAGFKTFPGDQRSVGVRYEGGVKWIRAQLGNLTELGGVEEALELPPLEEFFDFFRIEMGGNARMIGPHGGVFLDFHPNDSDHFIYVGSSYGLVKLGVDYSIRIGPSFGSDGVFSSSDSNWIPILKHEVGMGLQVTKDLALKVGYELSTFGTTELMTGLDKIQVAPTNRHNFKISLLHWFRRR